MKGFAFPAARFATLLLAVSAWHSSVFASITVPGTANPTLAGMPDGSPGPGTGAPYYYWGDYAPYNSPVQATSVPIVPGAALAFSATGSATVQNYGGFPYAGPNGYDYPVSTFGVPWGVFTSWPIRAPAAPAGSLVGVFLDDNNPIGLSPPEALNFSSSGGNVPGGLFYSTLSPGLRQIFFIGDGHNAEYAFSGIQQQIIVPEGATRLYLGYGDYGDAANNAGSFNVDVSTVPEPSTIAIWSLLAGVGSIAAWRRRKRTA